MSHAENPWRLACFDLDGTLIRETSTCQHLSKSLGHEAVLLELEEKYASGAISNRDVAEADAEFYAGLTLSDVAALLEDVPVIRGIAETIDALKARGIPSLLCTVTWRFAAMVIAERYGFVNASGTEMGLASDGSLSGYVSVHFDEFDKLAFVREYCRTNDIPLSSVFAVGDSRSDIPLFGAVGFAVVLNATPQAKSAASRSLQTEWLPDVLAVIPALYP